MEGVLVGNENVKINIMAKYASICGPEAKDYHDDFTTRRYATGRTVQCRSHAISGKGIVESCAALNHSDYEESYNVYDGITQLGDKCFNKVSIDSISLPKTLEIIGNSCFMNTKISNIELPANLKKMGHYNFPHTLTSLKLPPLLEEFFVDNVTICSKLTSIEVDPLNKKYKSVEGILYNHDMTEILFCPNAKSGKVIIPNSVKLIGDYCFQGCKSLKELIIPPSVEYIGESAFCDSCFEKLVIPNSVKALGTGCFKYIVIKDFLKLSIRVSVLPKECFYGSDITKLIYHYTGVTEIGDNAFGNCKKGLLPSSVSFKSLENLGVGALDCCNQTDIFNLFSSLNRIEEDAFRKTRDNVTIQFFSYCPIDLPLNAFRSLPDNATLVVPKGTKVIFQNASPWSMISNIQESEIDTDYRDCGDKVLITEGLYIERLRSIAQSKLKADRNYLQDIIEDTYLNYLYVDSDDAYNEALDVIKYNRSFSPVIVPELEQKMCQYWSVKYRLKLYSTYVLDQPAYQVVATEEVPIAALPNIDHLTLPGLEIKSDLEKGLSSSVQVIFNEDIQKELQSVLTLAKKSLKIAVSWFTNYSLFKQVKEIAASGVNVQLITNNDLTNNGGYCLNLNELIQAGVEVNLIEYPHLLHHKFCIIDDNIVVNGSYNWTRFSAKNYENITIIRNDFDVIDAFADEFNTLLQNAEHKCIKEMPEFVPERPEYDRGAFRQYVTEELDAEARETPLERDKITALQKAATLNSDYLEKINPEAKRTYADAFKAVDESIAMRDTIVAMVQNKPITPSVVPNVSSSSTNNTRGGTTSVHQTSMVTSSKPIASESRATQQVIEKVKASNLFMVLDVSGSMKDTYKAGHVHNISKKALSASLAITDSKEVSLWTFGNNSQFEGNVGIDSITKIDEVLCTGQRTNLMKFVEAANTSIEDNALVIIFTDDDDSSISNAISAMQERSNVFWQIIVYGGPFDNITKSISNVANTSVVSLTDYASKTNEQISELLLKDYIVWKKRQ